MDTGLKGKDRQKVDNIIPLPGPQIPETSGLRCPMGVKRVVQLKFYTEPIHYLLILDHFP